MIDVSVCIITYNKYPFLRRALAAFFYSIDKSKNFELLIYDNGSTDYTVKYLPVLPHICPDNVKCSVFVGKENVGLNAYGLLVPCATGEIIVTMDDDIFDIEPPGWEERFRRILFTKFDGRRFGYVSTDTINEDGGRIKDGVIGHASVGGMTVEVGPAGGWFAATTREVLELVGGFHTGKGKMHLEDLDFQQRVWEKGLLVGTLLDTQVFHARAPWVYQCLGSEETYREKIRLAELEGITLEPLA